MLRRLISNRKIQILFLIAFIIRLIALSPSLTETLYSQGFYPCFSRLLRGLLGWLPFSFGDLLYAAAGIFLLWKMVRWVQRWRAGHSKQALLERLLQQTITGLLAVYVVFQLFWGLNYNRQGIAAQLGLQVLPYALRDLDILAIHLQERLEETSAQLDTTRRVHFDNTTYLTAAAKTAYDTALRHYPFLAYRTPSLKPSLYSGLGQYIGFTGYYNPFTAEAQIKTSIPNFLKPFVATHEIAHQLGYAKESEANFVAFLSSHRAASADVRYAVYFELFLYTLSDIRSRDTAQARKYREAAPPQVQRDLQTLAAYLERSRNPIEPYMAKFYDAYLRWNNQPKGRESYNEVVAWMVAYGKKFGRNAI